MREYDLPKVQGDWSVAYLEESGKPAPKESAGRLKLTVGSHATLDHGDGRQDFTLALDPGPGRKKVDLRPTASGSRGRG